MSSLPVVEGDRVDREELNVNHETLRIWVHRAETDTGARPVQMTKPRSRTSMRFDGTLPLPAVRKLQFISPAGVVYPKLTANGQPDRQTLRAYERSPTVRLRRSTECLVSEHRTSSRDIPPGDLGALSEYEIDDEPSLCLALLSIEQDRLGATRVCHLFHSREFRWLRVVWLRDSL